MRYALNRNDRRYTLTLEDCATALNLSVDQVRRLCKHGRLDARKLPDVNHRRALRWFVSESAVQGWLERG